MSLLNGIPRRLKKIRGVSVIEATVALPVIILFLLAIIDLCRIFWAEFGYRDALRLATRAAAISAAGCVVDQADIQNRFMERAAVFGLRASPLSFQSNVANTSGQDQVSVAAEMPGHCIMCSLVGMNPSYFHFNRTRTLATEKQNQGCP